MFCKKCGKEINDEAVMCIYCGCSTQEKQSAAVDPKDAPSTGMAVLGFFIPIVGLILWLVNKDTKPLMAKSAGKGALIGTIVTVVLYAILGGIYGAIIGSLMGSTY